MNFLANRIYICVYMCVYIYIHIHTYMLKNNNKKRNEPIDSALLPETINGELQVRQS